MIRQIKVYVQTIHMVSPDVVEQEKEFYYFKVAKQKQKTIICQMEMDEKFNFYRSIFLVIPVDGRSFLMPFFENS